MCSLAKVQHRALKLVARRQVNACKKLVITSGIKPLLLLASRLISIGAMQMYVAALREAYQAAIEAEGDAQVGMPCYPLCELHAGRFHQQARYGPVLTGIAGQATQVAMVNEQSLQPDLSH